MEPLAKARLALTGVPPTSRVGVVLFLGSLCPITLAHVQCCEEARKVLLGEPSPDHPLPLPRPTQLETCAAVVGFVACNGDGFVRNKLAKKGEPALSQADRLKLVQKAVQGHPWLCASENCFRSAQQLQADLPSLRFTVYELGGADDSLKYHKWAGAGPGRRYIVMGRPPERGQENGTQALIAALRADHVDYDQGYFIVGPELEDISSSAVRELLRKGHYPGNLDKLRAMLHPDVLQWNLTEGPYAPPAAPTPPAAPAELPLAPPPSPGSAAILPSPPLGLFQVCRNSPPFTTALRVQPTLSRERADFLSPKVVVPDGQTVALLELDPSFTFGKVSFQGSRPGYLQLKYLHAGKGTTHAVLQRGDGKERTSLRVEDREARVWVPGPALLNGTRVTVLWPNEGEPWKFLLVMVEQRVGWVKAAHLKFTSP